METTPHKCLHGDKCLVHSNNVQEGDCLIMVDEEGVNPKDLLGVKKAPLRLVPPALAIGTAPVMALGARKYGAYNWRTYPVKLSVYLEAIERHYLAVKDGQWLDPESGEPHIFHISACVSIIADAKANGSLVEDWPVSQGPAAALLSEQDGTKETPTTSVDVSTWGEEEPTAITWEEHTIAAPYQAPFQGEFGPIDIKGVDCE